ncbi:MAG: DUF2683 family protein [Candidatus Diapherotrites archaeon]|nr:DUF2683 family protein [Candidatus Diapherotrites archaeon]
MKIKSKHRLNNKSTAIDLTAAQYKEEIPEPGRSSTE